MERKITIYILRLEGDYYYVGKTYSFNKRFRKHGQGKGAAWTKLHKVLDLYDKFEFEIEKKEDEEKWENFITIKMMKEKGWNRVRGGFWCNTSDYDTFKGLQHHGYFLELKQEEQNFKERKYIIFVLKLVENKYFVGFTHDLKIALKKHNTGKASKWTKTYKPIEIIKIKEITCHTDKIDINKVDEIVFECFQEYGLENVRGGRYVQIDENKHFEQYKLNAVTDIKLNDHAN